MDKIGGDALVEWAGAGEKAVAFLILAVNYLSWEWSQCCYDPFHWLPRLQKEIRRRSFSLTIRMPRSLFPLVALKLSRALSWESAPVRIVRWLTR